MTIHKLELPFKRVNVRELMKELQASLKTNDVSVTVHAGSKDISIVNGKRTEIDVPAHVLIHLPDRSYIERATAILEAHNPAKTEAEELAENETDLEKRLTRLEILLDGKHDSRRGE